MLTPTDHQRLASYTTMPTLTQEQADDIKHCIPGNTYHYENKCKWVYPVGDDGYPAIGLRYEWYIQPVRSVSRGGCAPNPNSISAQAPWLKDDKSRSYWYACRAQAAKHAEILSSLPPSMRENTKVGLKLYKSCAALAKVYNLDINELWGQVCEGVRKVQPRGAMVPKLMSEWVKEGG
jgi:hypothetical protein